jgi:hypothetical protein
MLIPLPAGGLKSILGPVIDLPPVTDAWLLVVQLASVPSIPRSLAVQVVVFLAPKPNHEAVRRGRRCQISH